MLFSRSVMSNSLQPHGLQHTRLPYPPLSPGVYSNSCPLSQWCYLTISSSVAPFSFCFQSFPSSGSFSMSWLLASGDQSIGASAPASDLPNEYSGLISFRIDWSDLLAIQGTLKILLQYHSSKRINSLVLSFLYGPPLTSTHDYWKNHIFDYMDLCWQRDVSASQYTV